jgi:hypothetical protein
LTSRVSDKRIRRDLKTIKKLEDNLRVEKVDNYKKAGWSTGWAGKDLTKKELEILHYIAEHVRTHPFKDRLKHIDKYRKRLGLRHSKKFNIYRINGKLSIPERKKILQSAGYGSDSR